MSCTLVTEGDGSPLGPSLGSRLRVPAPFLGKVTLCMGTWRVASFSVAVLGHSAGTRGPGDPLAFASSSKWVVLGVGPLLLGRRRSWAHGGLSGGAVWLTVSAFLCAWSEGLRRVPHAPPRGCTGDPRVVSLVASAPETEARRCLSTGFYATCIM